MSTMIIEPTRRAFVIVESELDGIAVATANDLAGAVALGSVAAKPDAEAFAILRGSIQILNALDYGDIGGGAKAAEKAIAWWHEQFAQCDRWPVPEGKDPGEAYQMGIDLKSWIKAGLPPALTIEAKNTGEGALRKEISFPMGATPPPPTTTAHTEPVEGCNMVRQAHHEREVCPDPPPLPKDVRELLTLLRNNPGVKIINQPDRYTVLRQGKFVGGRINELVFHSPDVLAYIANHPAAEIDGLNLVNWEHM
jgi:hypothetical protein